MPLRRREPGRRHRGPVADVQSRSPAAAPPPDAAARPVARRQHHLVGRKVNVPPRDLQSAMVKRARWALSKFSKHPTTKSNSRGIQSSPACRALACCSDPRNRAKRWRSSVCCWTSTERPAVNRSGKDCSFSHLRC